MKRFMVAVNDATHEQRDAITKLFKDNGLGFWHWFQDVWLLTTYDSDIDSRKIRDEIQKIASGVHCLVLAIEGDPGKWAGYGSKEHFEWLNKTWMQD